MATSILTSEFISIDDVDFMDESDWMVYRDNAVTGVFFLWPANRPERTIQVLTFIDVDVQDLPNHIPSHYRHRIGDAQMFPNHAHRWLLLNTPLTWEDFRDGLV